MDWVALLEANNIAYVTRSKNTARGEISVQCPMCGSDDPSQHMGISLTHEAWGCLRNPLHVGKSPITLIAALLGCGIGPARLIARQYSMPDPDNLETLAAQLEATSDRPKADTGHVAILQQPEEFKFVRQRGTTLRFWDYLEVRGFHDPDALVNRYKIQCATTGRWKDRVIIPLYQKAQLSGWTGRAIADPIDAPRYLSEGAIKETVFNEDVIRQGGDTLFICEGPFDAIKLDYYAPEAVRATCSFGTTVTPDQLFILNQLRWLYRQLIILFDQDAVEPAFYAADWLRGDNIKIGQLPPGVKDPGALSAEQVREYIRENMC